MTLSRYSQSDIKDKKIILRLDLDVSISAGKDLRLERAVNAIQELLLFGARRIVVIGHRGRPAFAEASASASASAKAMADKSAGKPDGKSLDEFFLKPVRDNLARLLTAAGIQDELTLVPDMAADPAGFGSQRLLMLENLRFWPGEKAGDSDFASQLAGWGDVYVNDAFGNSHRSDASMLALPQTMLKAFAGPGLVNEIQHLDEFKTNPEHPYAVVLGGAKIETKLPLIKSFLSIADIILVGGGLANTFFKARGYEIGKSYVDEPFLDQARSLLSDKLILPVDAVITDSQGARVAPVTAVPADGFIGDIGPQTVALYKQKMTGARLILFNGPMGKFEDAAFSQGTKDMVEAIVTSSAKTLTGGGDTLDLVHSLGVTDKFGFVSVGGGAMLTFLAGEPMPALDVLCHTK